MMMHNSIDLEKKGMRSSYSKRDTMHSQWTIPRLNGKLVQNLPDVSHDL